MIYRNSTLLIKCKKQIKEFSFNSGFRILITVISFVFLGHSILVNLEKISFQYFNKYTFIFISYSFIITCISIFLNAFSWKFLIEWMGYDYTHINIIKLFIQTNIYKYTPGGVWHFISRIKVISTVIPLSNSMLYVFLEPFLMLVSAMLWLPFGDFNLGLKIFAISTAFVFHYRFRSLFIFIVEKLILTKINKLYSSQSIKGISSNLEISRQSYPFQALFSEMVFVLFRFLGFWLCLHPFSINTTLSFFDWLSVFSLAWIVGLVVPAAPGGVGLFESTMLLIVGNVSWEINLLSALVCYRVVSILSDLFTYSLVSFGNKKIRTNF